jgi:hypothetical protein
MTWDITQCNIIFTQVLSYLKSTLCLLQLDIYNLSDEENIDNVTLSNDETPRSALLLPYHTVILEYINQKLIELGTDEIKPKIQKILDIFDWGADLICTTRAKELADCIGIDTESENYDQDRFIFSWTNLMTSLCLRLKLQYLYLFEQTVSTDCCSCDKAKGQTQEDYESWSSGVYPSDEVYDRTNYARTGSAWGLTTEPGKCECNRHE